MKLKVSCIIAAVCSIILSANCCFAAKPAKKEMAIQLYSARDLIGNAEKYAASHEEVLKALARMGYTAVEAANYKNGLFYGVTPEEFKADVEAAGMTVLSSHTNKKLSEKELKSGDFLRVLHGGTKLSRHTKLPEWNTSSFRAWVLPRHSRT